MKKKIALLINVRGAELKDIHNGLTWAAPTEDVPDESKVYTRVTAKMDVYFNVKKNQLSAWRTFSTMSERSTESLEQFITIGYEELSKVVTLAMKKRKLR